MRIGKVVGREAAAMIDKEGMVWEMGCGAGGGRIRWRRRRRWVVEGFKVGEEDEVGWREGDFFYLGMMTCRADVACCTCVNFSLVHWREWRSSIGGKFFSLIITLTSYDLFLS